MYIKTLLASAIVASVSSAAYSQTPDGQQAFNNSCRTCHTVKAGDNRQGPSLAGIVGKKAGTTEGFNFSPSLAQSDLTWDEATLDKFIENPEAVASGNAMKPYGGVADPAQRKSIIEYLKSAN